jgi:hypothetical protein
MSTSLHCPRCDAWHNLANPCDPTRLAEAIRRSFEAEPAPADEQERAALGRWRART